MVPIGLRLHPDKHMAMALHRKSYDQMHRIEQESIKSTMMYLGKATVSHRYDPRAKNQGAGNETIFDAATTGRSHQAAARQGGV